MKSIKFERALVQVTAKTSAVLVPIILNIRPYILLTQRANDLRKHAGQICFPGGEMEPGETHQTTAIREFNEELGASCNIKIVGELPKQLTSTNYTVYPVCGLIESEPKFNPCVHEVADIIKLPLDIALNRSNFKPNTNPACKVIRHRDCLNYEDHFVWGVTATILKSMTEDAALFKKIVLATKLS